MNHPRHQRYSRDLYLEDVDRPSWDPFAAIFSIHTWNGTSRKYLSDIQEVCWYRWKKSRAGEISCLGPFSNNCVDNNCIGAWQYITSPWDVAVISDNSVQFSRSVMSDSVTPQTAACQASLSITNSWRLLKLMSIESMMPSSHLILCDNN